MKYENKILLLAAVPVVLGFILLGVGRYSVAFEHVVECI